jgi:serine/threonine-protein kinase
VKLKAGDRIGEYVLEAPLGRGGAGTVWRARHGLIASRRVALKFPHDDALLAWLRREGLLQAQLDHTGVVKVLGGDLDGEAPYMVLELVEGGDLRAALAAGPLGVDRARAIARGILEALSAAHQAEIVHGDLKPENVLLTKDGGVKLTDFGLAQRLLGAELEHSLAASRHQVAGTLRYLPPEVLERGSPSTKSDLYAFGVLLFELLVGRVPQGLERLADHGVDAPDLSGLFQACYVPEARRLSNAAAALELLARLDPGRLPREPSADLKAFAAQTTAAKTPPEPPAPEETEATAPRGRLIRRRPDPRADRPSRPTGSFFARLFGWTGDAEEADDEATPAATSSPAPDPEPAAAPANEPPAAAPSPPPWVDLPAPRSAREVLSHWRGRPVSVAAAKSAQGQWDWLHVDTYLRSQPGEVLALDLSGGLADDRAVALAGELVDLGCLDLSEGANLTDAALPHVGRLRRLTYLSLRGCSQLTDAGLGHLRGLELLSSLDLTGCAQLTDVGLRQLTSLGSLRFLFLDGCTRVTTAGVNHVVQHTPVQWVSR